MPPVLQKTASIIVDYAQRHLHQHTAGTWLAAWCAECQTVKLSYPASYFGKTDVSWLSGMYDLLWSLWGKIAQLLLNKWRLESLLYIENVLNKMLFICPHSHILICPEIVSIDIHLKFEFENSNQPFWSVHTEKKKLLDFTILCKSQYKILYLFLW